MWQGDHLNGLGKSWIWLRGKRGTQSWIHSSQGRNLTSKPSEETEEQKPAKNPIPHPPKTKQYKQQQTKKQKKKPPTQTKQSDKKKSKSKQTKPQMNYKKKELVTHVSLIHIKVQQTNQKKPHKKEWLWEDC